MFNIKVFCFILFLFIAYVQAKPVEDSKVLEVKADGDMEAAESQNTFLPRFAMKALRERSQRARAQRRNYLSQRRGNQPRRVPCRERYYKK